MLILYLFNALKLIKKRIKTHLIDGCSKRQCRHCRHCHHVKVMDNNENVKNRKICAANKCKNSKFQRFKDTFTTDQWID